MTRIESKCFREDLIILRHLKRYYSHHHANQKIHQIIENSKYKIKKARIKNHKINLYNLEKFNNLIKSIHAIVNKKCVFICNTQTIKWHK